MDININIKATNHIAICMHSITLGCVSDSKFVQIQSTPLNRATSGPGCFDPIKRRNLLTENIVSQTVIPS